MEPSRDYAPPRWRRQTQLGGGINRWIIARPERLLAWWGLLLLLGIAGLVVTTIAVLTDGSLLWVGATLFVPACVGLVPDAPHGRRVWSAWRERTAAER